MIIKASENDIISIRNLAFEAWEITYKNILSENQIAFMLEKYYSVESLLKTIEETSQVFLVYKEDNGILGFISYELDYLEKNHLKIHKLYVHPKTQGLGIGKKLLSFISQLGIENSQKNLSLNVNKFNQPAIDFYEKVGLSKIKEEVLDIGNNYIMDDFVMGKSLIIK